jgi:hypothetical protein
MAADRLGQKTLRRRFISVLGEEEINRLARLVNSTVEIVPLAFDPDVGLVHPPADPHRPLAAMKGVLQLRAVFDDPAVDGGMIHVHSALAHEFFNVSCTQRVGDIPAAPRQNDVLWEMGPLEAHGHLYSPSNITLNNRGRAYRKGPQMKIATEPSIGVRE